MRGMRSGAWAVLIVLIILVALVAWFFWGRGAAGPTASSTPPAATSSEQTTTTPQGLSFTLPAAFALATGQEPIMVQSYIPPCDQGYDYCLYKNDDEFAGTNFESAGVSITDRGDLGTERLCLDTPPAGYASTITPDNTVSGDTYSASVFAGLGNAAAGHSAVDSYYRLYDRSNSTCTELDARVAESAYGNYPAGTIEEFTAADQAQVESELQSILNGMTLAPSGTHINWPSTS